MTELEIMGALADRLADITVENDYSSDAGNKVFQFRDGFSAPDAPPYIAVIFETREIREAASRFAGCPHLQATAHFLIVGAVQLGDDSGPAEPLGLLDDIDTALMTPDAFAAFAALGLTVHPGRATVLPHEEGDGHTEVQVNVAVDYAKAY